MNKIKDQTTSKWDDFSADDFEPFTGLNTERYESGSKKEEGRWLNGKKNGKWIYYNEDGSIKEVKEHYEFEK